MKSAQSLIIYEGKTITDYCPYCESETIHTKIGNRPNVAKRENETWRVSEFRCSCGNHNLIEETRIK